MNNKNSPKDMALLILLQLGRPLRLSAMTMSVEAASHDQSDNFNSQNTIFLF